MHQLKRLFGAGAMLVMLSATGAPAGEELPLIAAVQDGDLPGIQALLRGKASVNAARADGTTALFWAVYHDNKPAVSLLLEAGADVNPADDYGVTPLFMACVNGDAGLVNELLDHGADPNITVENGETPLMACADAGVVEGVRDLLSHGADVNASENKKDQTALMWAVAEGHVDVVRELIAGGADVHARSKAVPEPEPFVIDAPGITVLGSNYPLTIRYPEITGDFTALHFAAQQGNIASAQLLLQAGADVNAPHPEHGSALNIAIASGHQGLAEFLLKNGADPNIKDAWGITPLHFALHEGVLILNNFRPSTTDELGWERENMPELAEMLLDYGADPNARIEYSYAYLDNPFLARANEDPAQVNPVGATPLLLAAVSGDIESMNILEEVSDVSATTIGGATLFMLAAGAGVERNARNEQEAIQAATRALELGGGDIDDYLTEIAPDGPAKGMEDGRTAMHFAVSLGWTEMIKFLAERGADLEAKDRYGMTPLMLALGDPEGLYHRQVGDGNYDDQYRRPNPLGNKKVADLLLQLGARPFTGKYRDTSGE